jgi:hypothetical protein
LRVRTRFPGSESTKGPLSMFPDTPKKSVSFDNAQFDMNSTTEKSTKSPAWIKTSTSEKYFSMNLLKSSSTDVRCVSDITPIFIVWPPYNMIS